MQKKCIKGIHLVSDDGLFDRKVFYKIEIVFIHPPMIKNTKFSEYYFYMNTNIYGNF